jgi:hypothetical protein
MVLLNRAYGGYASGTVVELPADTEAALIAQGLAVTSAAPATSGAVSTTYNSGTVTVAIGASSVVVTNPQCTPSSKVCAYVAQAAADGTLLRVERIVCAAGSFTIFGTANATAATAIDWLLFPATGGV